MKKAGEGPTILIYHQPCRGGSNDKPGKFHVPSSMEVFAQALPACKKVPPT